MTQSTKRLSCALCESPNDFDEGTISMMGKLVCVDCQNVIKEFDK